MVEFRRLSGDFCVSPQIAASDVAAIAAAGFRMIINNRPDGEAPGQISSEEVSTLAKAAGLAYAHRPFTGMPDEAAVAEVSLHLAASDGPIFAYCRSGTRSASAWALAMARGKLAEPSAIIASAAAAGYDLSSLSPALRTLHAGL
jgi:uncharacterized protein (TIGR01244 family)